MSYASFSQGTPIPAIKPQQLAPVVRPQQTQYQTPQPLNQQRHIQYQTKPPKYQQQYTIDQEQLILDLQQPRSDIYRTAFPAVPIQVQPVYRQQFKNQKQPQYLQMRQYKNTYQNQNQQPQNQQLLNQNVQNEPQLHHHVIKYQPIPINSLAQAADIDRPIFFKPGSFQTTVYPQVQYFGKFAQSIFEDRLNQ